MDTQLTLQQRIGHAVRVIARDKGITMKSLAIALGMSKQSFYDRLRGKTALSVDELDRLAVELDVTAGALLVVPKTDKWYAPRESNPEPAGYGYVEDHIDLVAEETTAEHAGQVSTAA